MPDDRRVETRRQLDALPIGTRVRRTYGQSVTVDRKIAGDEWVIDEPEHFTGRRVSSALLWSNGATVEVVDA